MLGLAALISAAPVQAQSVTTLVSNFGQGHDSDTFTAAVRAQTFKTGWNATGFTLHSVDIRIQSSSTILASRLVAGKNNGWTLRMAPSGLGDVTLRVNGTTACNTAPGVCTADGRKLPGGLSVSSAGPEITTKSSVASAPQAPAAPRLFRPDADGRQGPMVADSSVTRSRRVRVNHPLLGGPSFSERRAPEPGSTVTLNLFDDAQFVAVLEYVDPLGDGA